MSFPPLPSGLPAVLVDEYEKWLALYESPCTEVPARDIQIRELSPGVAIPVDHDPRYIPIHWVKAPMGLLLDAVSWDWPRRVYDWQADGL